MGRRKPRCSICGRTGHNKLTCPVKAERTPSKNRVLPWKSVNAQNNRIKSLVPAKKWSKFKIGITGNPDGRPSSPEYREYSELILLYKTTSKKVVRQWEKDTAPIVTRFYARCENKVEKLGSGKLTETGPYFLYIVRRKK